MGCLWTRHCTPFAEYFGASNLSLSSRNILNHPQTIVCLAYFTRFLYVSCSGLASIFARTRPRNLCSHRDHGVFLTSLTADLRPQNNRPIRNTRCLKEKNLRRVTANRSV